jgi:DNA repair protein RadD
MLRPYQQRAHDKIIAWIKKTTEPCMIEAATGAGKSHIIAELAKTVREISGKHVLCIAPSKELVEQNHAKYPGDASFFSASVGIKCLEHPVVFGTPGTVKNSIERFGNEIGMIIIDECHGITPTIRKIIENIPNPNMRVVGMSATPYRMGTGYVFKQWEDGSQAGTNGFFTRCVDRVRAYELIEQGYLTPPRIGNLNASSYQTKHLKLNNMGSFSAADIEHAYHGHGRKTSRIIADIVEQSRDRRGVLIFAATVRHAQECLASLPPELSAIVTGETPKKEREEILSAFKAQRIKYIVNVSVLTTGFDATHVDVIAMMRATESVGLMQQIIGRGLRLHKGKTDCLVLDYAENIERHCQDGDIFNPNIEEKKKNGKDDLECVCPVCDGRNVFRARPNPDNYGVDRSGYFVDLDGIPVQGDFGPIPAHFGRRCTTVHLWGRDLRQCSYRWTAKQCESCEHENDIAARRCESCDAEMVDPNEKLRLDYQPIDLKKWRTDRVLGWSAKPSMSKAGNPTLMVKVVTEIHSFTFWIQMNPKHPEARALLEMYKKLNGDPPRAITYRKAGDFYSIKAFNHEVTA